MTYVNPYLGEFVGTLLLILFGDGVVANVLLNKSKGWALSGNGLNSGWTNIILGWGFAVMVGIAGSIWFGSPWAAINPAVAIAFAIDGKLPWSMLPGFIIVEILGAFFGAVLVFIAYHDHYKATEDPATKLATFSTIPNIRDLPKNFVTEAIGTFALVFGVYALTIKVSLPGALTVAFLVMALGLSLGGPTGYAINPARDLGPRLAHAVLLPHDSSDWSYGLIVPIFGPITGAIIAAIVAMVVL
ncbi:MAG: MIP/aquaporin family protein [bacterium]